MGDVVTLPLRPGNVVRLMRPDPKPRRHPLEERFTEIGNHAAAANTMAWQMLTNAQLGGCVCQRDVAEVAEGFARGFMEAYQLLGRPEALRPGFEGLQAWLTGQTDGGGHAA